MTQQRITVTHVGGQPIERTALEFSTLTGFRYRLTHYEVEDGAIVWVHGYRNSDGMRIYTSRTPDELDTHSLDGLR